MKPLYPDGRSSGLPNLRPDGRAIGPVIRMLAVVILAAVAWVMAASGFEVNEAVTFAQKSCAGGRGFLFCELGNLLARQIPPSSAGAVEVVLRVAFFVMLLGLIAWLLKPLLIRRRT